ncbi:MAG TPA: FtsX-like permease family protein [Silvibacterium sp.]|nr:FtsX-like permease family protein [Silvibacterium sp.]
MNFSIEGRPVSRMEDTPSALFGIVDANFLRTAEIPVLKGRDFSESDGEKSPAAAIVNQAFARRYFSDEDPIGRRIEIGTPANLHAPDRWLGTQHIQATIIGMMGNTKNQDLALPAEPQFITLFKQTPPLSGGFRDVLVRSEIAPSALIAALAEQLRQLDPQLPLSEATTMTEYVETYTSDQRFTTALLSGFAALGLVLAIVGIYGVVSYLVVQRHLEIGIRLALGATRKDVLWLIVRQGVTLALIGAAIGIAGMVILSHSMSSFLFGISALDLGTLCATSALLILIAILASAIPGRRATKIDPIEALRAE